MLQINQKLDSIPVNDEVAEIQEFLVHQGI